MKSVSFEVISEIFSFVQKFYKVYVSIKKTRQGHHSETIDQWVDTEAVIKFGRKFKQIVGVQEYVPYHIF